MRPSKNSYPARSRCFPTAAARPRAEEDRRAPSSQSGVAPRPCKVRMHGGAPQAHPNCREIWASGRPRPPSTSLSGGRPDAVQDCRATQPSGHQGALLANLRFTRSLGRAPPRHPQVTASRPGAHRPQAASPACGHPDLAKNAAFKKANLVTLRDGRPRATNRPLVGLCCPGHPHRPRPEPLATQGARS